MTRSERAARIIRTIVAALKPRFGLELWDGERLGPRDGPRLKVNDSGAIGKLLRRPTLDTVLQLWMGKAIDVADGSLFDIVALRPEVPTRHLVKALPKRRLLADAVPLLLRPGTASSGASGLAGRDPFSSGSDKQAIRHHYDISNDFYRLFLDQRMVYSCGYFTDLANDIDQAQVDKLDHICRKLRLKAGETLLDVGCGWGALLIHAAQNFGVTGLGISLSEAQTALARERITAAGLEGRVHIEIRSYTEIRGQFDKIASIGMFEHTGIANHDAYYRAIGSLLRPGGIYLHHAITLRNRPGRNAWRRRNQAIDAIVKYIFPGGELDHIGRTIGNLEAHGFEVQDVENLRMHYARTCRLWAERLQARMPEAIAEVGEARARLWLLYLTGCAIGFDRGSPLIYQTVATKRTRGPSGLPPTRADLYLPRGV